MTIELSEEQLTIITNALSYQEAKLWDTIGELNKQNASKEAKAIQSLADRINKLNANLTVLQ